MVHWVYIFSVVCGPLGVAAWRYAPRTFLMLVGGLTKDPKRSRQCAEMVRLSRKDAKDLPSYFTDSHDSGKRTVSRASAAHKPLRPSGQKGLLRTGRADRYLFG
jgi:hypothetical protein